jgi:hypothetical protein
MFCSFFFCHKTHEASKASALLDPESEEVLKLFPHLANLNQPLGPLDQDDTSISEESLFDEIPEPVSVPEPVSAPVLRSESEVVETPIIESTVQCSEDNIDQIIHALRVAEAATEPEEPYIPEEEAPAISKEEFIAVLHRIEKENAWHEKRQAKKNKGTGKKKARRNKKTTKNGGLQQRAANQSTILPVRAPLTSLRI